MARFLLLTLLAAAVAAACSTSPTGRSQLNLVSDAEIEQMGVTAFEQMKQQTPSSGDGRTNGYVACVANAITREVASNRAWEVRVFNDKDVNAFALPGGKIGVYTGLLAVARNQDQLASVIGHEVGHVVARHHNARISNQMAAQLGSGIVGSVVGVDPNLINAGAGVFLLRFDRRDETESDVLGQEIMARAGFDPRQSVELWRNMQRQSGGNQPPQWLSTHPSHDTRIQDLSNQLGRTMPLYEQARAAGKRPNCG